MHLANVGEIFAILILYLTDEEGNVIVCFIDWKHDFVFEYDGTPHLVYVYEVGPLPLSHAGQR